MSGRKETKGAWLEKDWLKISMHWTNSSFHSRSCLLSLLLLWLRFLLMCMWDTPPPERSSLPGGCTGDRASFGGGDNLGVAASANCICLIFEPFGVSVIAKYMQLGGCLGSHSGLTGALPEGVLGSISWPIRGTPSEAPANPCVIDLMGGPGDNATFLLGPRWPAGFPMQAPGDPV